MKIIHLKTENVQRVKVVEITPQGNSLVIVGGNNGHGKTSVLDSIMFGLAGKRELSARPVRDGAEEGTVEIRTGEFTVTRTIEASGKNALRVVGADGLDIGSPQKLLDSLTSRLTFDPLAFAGMEWKEQVAVIKSLIPFDFSGNERLRKNYYDERTYVNRELKAKEAENEANPFHPEIPIDEVSPNAVMEAIKEGADILAAKATLEGNIRRGKDKLASIERQVAELLAEKQKIVDWLATNEPKMGELNKLQIPDHQAELERINEQNARIRKNAEAKRIYAAMKEAEKKANDLTARIEKLDAEKMAAIEGASLPVAGLSFDDDSGVLYQRIPFAQLSAAERLKVSLAMGIALNPQLRILLIRDGSLLDQENLEVVRSMAEQHDMQVWLERVGKGDECSVIIEDGMVAEDRMVEQGEAR